MSILQAALYARVSSEHQAEANTIASQVAALQERATADGVVVSDAMTFLDDGYSGATLVRPALERLRDAMRAGLVDRLYVHAPDRLARKYAYQVVLIEEFSRVGVEVVFLNRELGHSPEDDLLLQVQGMMAEYERAKILERHRRGKLPAARAGSVNVLGGAPYGYRYINKHHSGGQARYDVIADEARVVRQVFEWIGGQRLSIGEVCRRLMQAGERTRTGRTVWDRSVVWDMLNNPAYMGSAAFGKTRQGPLRPRLRAQRGKPLHPRQATSTYDVPRENWTPIPVPALIAPDVYEAVQAQLQENRRHARQSCRRQTVAPEYAQAPPACLCLLPLSRDGRLSLWRGASLCQYPGAHGSPGVGGVARSLCAVGPPRARAARIRTASTRHGREPAPRTQRLGGTVGQVAPRRSASH